MTIREILASLVSEVDSSTATPDEKEIMIDQCSEIESFIGEIETYNNEAVAALESLGKIVY